MKVLTKSLLGVAIAGDQKNKRGYWVCSIVVAVLLGGLARPAHAGKQFNYVNASVCQLAGEIHAFSPLTYNDFGFLSEHLNSVEVVCPITWAKPAVPTGQIVGELDIQVDWVLPFVSSTAPPAEACYLAYLNPPGGGGGVQPLPIPYPVPTAMPNMKYAAVHCTVPSFYGILGISFNVCVTTPTNPGACPAP